MRLWSYWRSSCSYRVRIALNLKGLRYETVPVHLVRGGGEQHLEPYAQVHPQRLVPALQVSLDEPVLTQSLSIIEYLDERWPAPRLLPAEAAQRARVRSLSQLIATDVQPLQNVRVLNHLPAASQRAEWARHWMTRGFEALEAQLKAGDAYCVGDHVTIADLTLVPQVYNARRFGLDLSRFPKLIGIDERCRRRPAFEAARPENQPDAPRPEGSTSSPTATPPPARSVVTGTAPGYR